MRVWNKRKGYPVPPEGAILIDRTTRYGNPFKTGTRDENCNDYRDWLLEKLEDEPDFLEPLRNHDVICWCVPLRCHGDIAIAYANRDRDESRGD